MNREDIIRKMQDAGLKAPARGDFIFIHWDQIAMLLEHERAAEREACAKVCETEAANPSCLWEEPECWKHAAENCAGGIRARGETK